MICVLKNVYRGHVRKWNSLLQALTLLDELKSQGSGRESRREEERKEPTRGIRNVNSNRYALARSVAPEVVRRRCLRAGMH